MMDAYAANENATKCALCVFFIVNNYIIAYIMYKYTVQKKKKKSKFTVNKLLVKLRIKATKLLKFRVH